MNLQNRLIITYTRHISGLNRSFCLKMTCCFTQMVEYKQKGSHLHMTSRCVKCSHYPYSKQNKSGLFLERGSCILRSVQNKQLWIILTILMRIFLHVLSSDKSFERALVDIFYATNFSQYHVLKFHEMMKNSSSSSYNTCFV